MTEGQSPTKRPVGRPTRKTPYVVSKIMALARQGKTEQQIANIIGVNSSTLTYWKQKDWEFFITLNENKHLADQVVEASLFKKATGFEHTIEGQQVVTREGVFDIDQKVYIPPSDTAAIFWLKNRKPEEWKDRREEEHKILMVKKEVVSQLSTQELIVEAETLLSMLKREQKLLPDVQDPKIES